MTNADYVTWPDEFNAILFYLQKVTSLGEIGKIGSYLPYKKNQFS